MPLLKTIHAGRIGPFMEGPRLTGTPDNDEPVNEDGDDPDRAYDERRDDELTEEGRE